MDSMIDPCVLLQSVRDESGTIVDFAYNYANDAATAYLGMSSERLLGRSLLELMPGHAGSGLLARYARVVETGESLTLDDFTYEQELAGEERRYDIRVTRVGDGISAIWRDVTDRYRTAEALRVSEQRLRAALANSHVVVWEQDTRLRYTWIHNPRLGHEAEVVLGHSDEELLPPEEAKFLTEVKTRVIESGEETRVDVAAAGPEGPGYFDLSVQPLREPDGTIVGVRCAAVDITERKKTELELAAAEQHLQLLNTQLEERVRQRTADLSTRTDELTTANAQLRVTNRELEDFTYTIAHDLRAPLRAMVGFSDMLLEDYGASLGQEGTRNARVIAENARRLGRLVDDLLDFSQTGRRQVASEPVDMRALAESVAAQVRTDEPERDIEVQVSDLPPALGDEAMLRTVWTHLLANAVKFTASEKRAQITVTGDSEGARATYHVRDNGVGFDMTFSSKLFGVFQRLHPRESYPGTGMGLAIVARIVARHGGSAWAESQPGQGATFSFTIPAAEGISS